MFLATLRGGTRRNAATHRDTWDRGIVNNFSRLLEHGLVRIFIFTAPMEHMARPTRQLASNPTKL